VQDVLYKKPSTSANTILKGISNDENSSESDDDNDASIINDGDEDFYDGFKVTMTENDSN
jgi:hypothetical protein